jgi:hypothetical protein
MTTSSNRSRLTAMKKRGGRRRLDCSACVPPAPPHGETDRAFWLESGDLVHALPSSDARPDPAMPRSRSESPAPN